MDLKSKGEFILKVLLLESMLFLPAKSKNYTEINFSQVFSTYLSLSHPLPRSPHSSVLLNLSQFSAVCVCARALFIYSDLYCFFFLSFFHFVCSSFALLFILFVCCFLPHLICWTTLKEMLDKSAFMRNTSFHVAIFSVDIKRREYCFFFHSSSSYSLRVFLSFYLLLPYRVCCWRCRLFSCLVVRTCVNVQIFVIFICRHCFNFCKWNDKRKRRQFEL